jgi:division protein CdvB (Snf7/Vps24/ESCRT-III family)
MDASMNSMEMNLTMQNCSMQMSGVMKTSARGMRALNRMQNAPALQRIMQTFQKEMYMSDFVQEQTNDALDMMGEDNEEEEDEVVAQVLAEIGLANTAGLAVAPTGKIQQEAAQVDSREEDMRRRLAQLQAA